jgi:tetrahydromethanopterin S-methyltransferase subunit G
MGEIDISDIKDRLTRLEVQVIEKWASHDQRSDERWADLMEKMHELSGRKTPCTDHIKLMADMNGRIKATEKWQEVAGWAIGVLYAAIIGAIVKHFMG